MTTRRRIIYWAALSFGIPEIALGVATFTSSRALNFPNSAQGDAASAVAATSTNSAQCNVAGAPANLAFTITVPASATVTRGASSITINTFVANPASSSTNASGAASVTIGATRAAIGAGATTGLYTGTASITGVSSAGSLSCPFTINLTVIASLSITNVTGLAFGSGAPGDAAATVAPASGASFNITGEPNTSYTITLPASATMSTGGGGANKTIAVNSFTSSPSATGTLSAGGSATLTVGATRAALAAAQVTGAYTGTFTVTVTY